jgi:hypothetical protein
MFPVRRARRWHDFRANSTRREPAIFTIFVPSSNGSLLIIKGNLAILAAGAVFPNLRDGSGRRT